MQTAINYNFEVLTKWRLEHKKLLSWLFQCNLVFYLTLLYKDVVERHFLIILKSIIILKSLISILYVYKKEYFDILLTYLKICTY